MKTALTSLSLSTIAAFAFASALSMPAFAATTTAFKAKPPAKGCEGKNFVVQPQNPTTAHRYMLLMVFKKDTGGQYFGGASFSEKGCIGVLGGDGAKLTSDDDVLRTDVCPTDCGDPPDEPPGAKAKAVMPAKSAKRMMAAEPGKGTDPLATLNWGVLSATESPSGEPVPGNLFEVWQVVVKDACEARDMVNYYSTGGRILEQATKAGNLLGQMMIGYRNGTRGVSEECKAAMKK
jgi:hypothetical protein